MIEACSNFLVFSLGDHFLFQNESLISIDNLGDKVTLMAEVNDGKNSPDIAEIDIRILKADSKKEQEKIEGYEFEQVQKLCYLF